MARKKKPKALGLFLEVFHPDSMDWPEDGPRNPYAEQQDDDGFATCFEMAEMAGQNLIALSVRRGVSRQLAGRLLRKIAECIEHNEIDLLALTRGIEGHITNDGGVEASDWAAGCFDDDGNLTEIEPE
jgi:hypothetical protein